LLTKMILCKFILFSIAENKNFTMYMIPNGWAIKNDGLSILTITFVFFDPLTWLFFQKTRREIRYKTIWKELVQQNTMKLYLVTTKMLQNGSLSTKHFYKPNYFTYPSWIDTRPHSNAIFPCFQMYSFESSSKEDIWTGLWVSIDQSS
jgi:hypothetical protein